MSVTGAPLILAFAVYFAALVALSFLKPRFIHRTWIFLFKALFPSWRFFDELGAFPLLFVRRKDGDWMRALAPPPRKSFTGFFLNAETNAALAADSLLRHFLEDLERARTESAFALEKTVSYRLLNELARHASQKLWPAAEEFQFKICAEYHEPQGSRTEDLVISPLETARV